MKIVIGLTCFSIGFAAGAATTRAVLDYISDRAEKPQEETVKEDILEPITECVDNVTKDYSKLTEAPTYIPESLGTYTISSSSYGLVGNDEASYIVHTDNLDTLVNEVNGAAVSPDRIMDGGTMVDFDGFLLNDDAECFYFRDTDKHIDYKIQKIFDVYDPNPPMLTSADYDGVGDVDDE